MTDELSAGSAAREDIERAILGSDEAITSADVVNIAGGSAAEARALWRALGFADPGESPAFHAADLEAITLLLDTVRSGAIDFDTGVRLTRAVGRTMARLADWQVSTLSEYVEDLESSGEGTGSRLTTALNLIRSVEPPFEKLMVYAWRRHLAAAVGRVEALGASDADLHTATVSVGFADLVGFTRLSNGMDEEQLAILVETFETACADVVAGRGGRVIKTLGDSVLFLATEAIAAVDIALDIVESIAANESLPDVHVGLATGPVVLRLGDVFGSPVNMASRLTGVARRNRVICDAATAAAIADPASYEVRPMPPRPIRGFGTVEPISVRRR